MDITPLHAKIVKKILATHFPHQTKIYIFGSRATKAKKKFSDLDLGIDANEILPISVIASLEQDFSESDLPYKVDIVDLNNISSNFLKKIQTEMILFFKT